VLDADGTPIKSTYRLPIVCYEVPDTTKQASPKKQSKRRQSDAAQAPREQQQKVYIVYLALNTYYKKISETGRADVPGEKIVDVIQIADRKFATLGELDKSLVFVLNFKLMRLWQILPVRSG
jgi:hypothetical protein